MHGAPLSDSIPEPSTLGLCSLVVEENASRAKCGAGQVAVSGGIDCRMGQLWHDGEEGDDESAGSQATPISEREWVGACMDNKGGADKGTTTWGTVWVLCCPIPSTLDPPEYLEENKEAAKLPQFTSCYYRTTDTNSAGFRASYRTAAQRNSECRPVR